MLETMPRRARVDEPTKAMTLRVPTELLSVALSSCAVMTGGVYRVVCSMSPTAYLFLIGTTALLLLLVPAFEAQELRAVLQRIKAECRLICVNFELCTHVICHSAVA